MDLSFVSPGKRAIASALAAACLWGAAAVAVRQLHTLAVTSGVTIGFFRLAIAFPALAVMCLATAGTPRFHLRPSRFRPDWSGTGLMVLAGISLAVSHVSFYLAIERVGTGVSALITSAVLPLATAGLGRMFLGEPLSRGLALSVALAMGGAALLLGGDGIRAAGDSRFTGALLAVSAALFLALVTLFSRFLARRRRPLVSATVTCGAAALVLGPLAFNAGSFPEIGFQAWLLLGLMGLASTALAYGLYFTALRHIPSATAGVLGLGEPLTAVLLAWLLLDERLGLFGWLGAAAVAASFLNLYRLQAVAGR